MVAYPSGPTPVMARPVVIATGQTGPTGPSPGSVGPTGPTGGVLGQTFVPATQGGMAFSYGTQGPNGSHNTIQAWLAITGPAGTTVYIACF